MIHETFLSCRLAAIPALVFSATLSATALAQGPYETPLYDHNPAPIIRTQLNDSGEVYIKVDERSPSDYVLAAQEQPAAMEEDPSASACTER